MVSSTIFPLKKQKKMATPEINNTPAAFLPSQILDMDFKVLKVIDESIMSYVSLLCWCPVQEVKLFFDQTEEKLEESFKCDYQREYWSQHELYKEKKQTRTGEDVHLT